MHWALQYIGLPWVATAEGPDAFNCWTFFRWVQRRHYGCDLPLIPWTGDLMSAARAFRDHRARRDWVSVSMPADGDAIMMRRGDRPIHIGVWVDTDQGGVLHCAEDSGVVFQSIEALRLNGWSVADILRRSGGGS